MPLTTNALNEAADRTSSQVDRAIDATKDALDNLQGSVQNLRQRSGDAVGRAAEQVQDLTRRGMERARAAADGMRDQVSRASDQTVGYIRDEPLKAVLIAAAVGAGIAVLVRMLSRPTRNDRV
jgi:ElaB/YqjD/DUF883 family membrane-anchored ribosome-binding protein